MFSLDDMRGRYRNLPQCRMVSFFGSEPMAREMGTVAAARWYVGREKTPKNKG